MGLERQGPRVVLVPLVHEQASRTGLSPLVSLPWRSRIWNPMAGACPSEFPMSPSLLPFSWQPHLAPTALPALCLLLHCKVKWVTSTQDSLGLITPSDSQSIPLAMEAF